MGVFAFIKTTPLYALVRVEAPVCRDRVDGVLRDEMSHRALGARRSVALRLLELQAQYKHLDLIEELPPCVHPDFGVDDWG